MDLVEPMERRQISVVRSGVEALDLDRVARMHVPELRRLYREVLERSLPSWNSEYARRKIAWHLQAERESGLPESARQRALGIAQAVPLSLRLGRNVDRRADGLPLEHSVTAHVVDDQDSRLPMPGSLLVKRHKDRNIVVRVLTSGFEYDGRCFGSLSAIATEITGTKWNGFLFFGLTKGRTRGR